MKNDSQKYDEKKIAQYVKKRKELQGQIKRLKLQQQQQRKKSRSKSPSQDHIHKHFRSNFTQKQHMQISRIIKKSQDFQHKLQAKDKQIQQKMIKQKRQKQKARIKYLEQLKLKKKQQSMKSIYKIHQCQMLRQQKLKKQNRKYQQVKKIKSLYEKIQEQDKIYEQQQKLKQLQILKNKKKSMSFNFQQIKHHQKKYYQTVRMTKQKIQNQLLQKIKQMKENQKLQSQTFRPSKFLLTIWNQEKQKQIKEKQKLQKMKSLYTKKTYYQQQIREIHKQQIKTKPKSLMKKSIIDQKIQQKRLKVKSISAADIYKQGQQYMKTIHASITPVLVEQSKVELQNNYKSIRDGSKTQYKNYLQQCKLKRQTQYKSTGKLTTKQNPQMFKLQTIISSKKQNSNEKLYKAKIIAQKLDQKARNSSTAALVDSIAAKLKIIEEFS